MMGWGDLSTSPPAKDTFELRPDDIVLLQEELKSVRSKWRSLGDALNMSDLVLEMIETEYFTHEHFREVIKRWLRSTEPKPSWQCLVTALRQIGEISLVRHLRYYYTIAPDLEVDVSMAQETMECLSNKFSHILHLTLHDINKRESDTSNFFTFITLLPVALKAQHLRWFMEHISQITRSTCAEEMFDLFSTYWNFMHTSLVHYIIKNYGEEGVKDEIKEFEKDVEVFRRNTSICVFWRIWPEMELQEVPTDIMELVRTHRQDWPRATLEDLEKFRKTGFIKYSLPELALMIKSVMPTVW